MKILDVLKEEIEWIPMESSKRKYVCNKYPSKECFLIMNDFPEEPFWTLFFFGEFLDFDDEPKQWKITYKSQLN